MAWRSEHSDAVVRLKEAPVSAASLRVFDPDKSIVLTNDASEYAIGAVLGQEGVPAAFKSRKLRERERYMPASESQLRAMVYALMKWKSERHQALGRRDRPCYVKLDAIEASYSELAVLAGQVTDFNIQVGYKPGRKSRLPDVRSRRQGLVRALQVRGGDVW